MTNISPAIQSALENIYISPLETCNLNCKLCYTPKTRNVLSNAQILKFIKRYSSFIHKSYLLNLRSVLFCGGEVFVLKNFPRLINNLLKKGLFITIITNGTIDHLAKIKDPANCQLLVSFDGPKEVHDANRGQGNFDKSRTFVRHALALGFPVEIMYLVTPSSYPYISHPELVEGSLSLKFNYITLKSKQFNADLNFPSLTSDQILNIKRNYPTVPAKNFGCFQLSLQSNGQIYGCCESPHPLSKISDPIPKIIDNFTNSLSVCSNCYLSSLRGGIRRGNHNLDCFAKPRNDKPVCNGCCDPDFLCGYKQELSLLSCKDVVKSFHGSDQNCTPPKTD